MSDNNKKSQFKGVTHVIFDLDGLMVDTEMWGFNNFNSLLKNYGKECSLEFYSKHVGVVPTGRAQIFIDQFNLECNAEQLVKDWIQECLKHLDDIKLMPGVEKLVQHLSKHDIPVAIATTSKRIEFNAKTKSLQNIFQDGKYFKHIVVGDDSDVKRLKPYPDLFQVCASKFSPVPDPQNVLVFEDSAVGVSAAVAAHMQCVMVCDKRFGEIKDSNATIVIESLEEFEPQLFNLPHF